MRTRCVWANDVYECACPVCRIPDKTTMSVYGAVSLALALTLALALALAQALALVFSLSLELGAGGGARQTRDTLKAVACRWRSC